MAIKKIQINAKTSKNLTAESWINNRSSKKNYLRLTVLVPEELFKTFKISCAQHGKNMSHEIVAMLEKKYGAE